MLARLCLLIFAGLITVGNLAYAAKQQQLPFVAQISQTRTMVNFNRVMIEGRINVNLHTGYAKPQIILRGDPRDLANTFTEVKSNRLLIYFNKGYPCFGTVSADIRGRNLNAFTFHGAGNVTGLKLHSGFLDLFINNPGTTRLGGSIYLHKLAVRGGGTTMISGVSSRNLTLVMADRPHVQLNGMMNLSHLRLEGQGMLSLYWVKSDDLTIRAKDQAFVQLAGITNRLDVELCDKARFNGRYLRANRAFVKTRGHSVAEMSAVKHQHTLATDASDIYFYNLAQTRTDFMAYNGSVLDMRDWNLIAEQEYTRYNK